MPDLLIRGLPDETHQRLKARAASQGMSVNEMLVRELSDIAGRPTLAEWVVEVDGGRREHGPSVADISQVISEGRAER